MKEILKEAYVKEVELVHKYFNKYWDEFEAIYGSLPDGQYDTFEGFILYSMIREHKPKNVIEIGSYYGRSTLHTLHALEANGNYDNFYVCDFTQYLTVTRQEIINRRMQTDKVKFVEGDIRDNINLIPLYDIDLLFIDAAHEAHFAEWYFGKIIPWIGKDTLIQVHDINLYDDWEWVPTLDSEAEVFIRLYEDGTLPIEKILWVEDWCFNPDYAKVRNNLAKQYPIIKTNPAPRGVWWQGGGAASWWYKK